MKRENTHKVPEWMKINSTSKYPYLFRRTVCGRWNGRKLVFLNLRIREVGWWLSVRKPVNSEFRHLVLELNRRLRDDIRHAQR